MVSVVNDLQTKDLGWAGKEPCAGVLGGRLQSDTRAQCDVWNVWMHGDHTYDG